MYYSVAYGCYVCWVLFLQLYAPLTAICVISCFIILSFPVSCHLTNKD